MAIRTPLTRREQITRTVAAVFCMATGVFMAFCAWLMSNQAMNNGNPNNAWLIRAGAVGVVVATSAMGVLAFVDAKRQRK